MGKSLKIGIIIVVVALAAGGIAWTLGSNDEKSDNNQDQNTRSHSPETTNQTTKQNSNEAVAATVTYTSGGFEPSDITVKSGDKIKIVNKSGSRLEFSSDPHPSHTTNPELNAGDTENGQSATITVTKTGKWGFHNHYNPGFRGFVTVE